jgi:transposase
MKTKDARTLSPDGQETLRLIAVRAVLAGKTHQEAADLVGVARPTVTKWMKLYRQGGEKALKIRPKGRPKGGCLAGWQAAIIVKTIRDKYPDQMKLPWALWTREAVGKLIEKRFGIKLSVWAIGKYLKKWGLAPQKPIRRAYERDPKAVEQWLHQEYPKIRLKAKKEKAEIHWCDEMGVRSHHLTGTTWGLKGETPVIPGTGRRFSCNMISSISNRGVLRFKLFDGSFTTGIFIDFMRRLVRSSSRKVFLILDNHSVHKAKKVRDWVERHQEEIALFFLPAYSPELNPVADTGQEPNRS